MIDGDSVSLKEFLLQKIEESNKRYDQRFSDYNKATEAALASQKEAVTKAETSTEKRFESVNEFRNTLSDQQRTLMPRPEADVRFSSIQGQLESVNKEINALRESRSAARGKGMGLGLGWAILLGAISAAGVIATVIHALTH